MLNLGRVALCKKKKKEMSTNVVDECDRRVSSRQNYVRPYQTSKKPRQKIGEPKPIFCEAILSYFFVCLVSQNPVDLPMRKQVWYHVNSKARQIEKYFSATSMGRENFARFPYQNFDFQRFQGAAGVGPYMSLLTDEQEQRGSSFNYYGSKFFKPDHVQCLFSPNLLLLLPMLLQLLYRRRNSMKH